MRERARTKRSKIKGIATLAILSVFITACSSKPAKTNRPDLHEFDSMTVDAVAREDKYDPLIYCDTQSSGLFGCPAPTPKTTIDLADLKPKQEAIAVLPAKQPEPTAQDTSIADVLFDFDKSELKDRAKQNLTALRDAMRGKRIVLDGFTDSIGTTAYNDKLALARANAVRDFLISLNIPGATIEAAGKGACCFVAPNDSDESRRLNRRVEVRLKGAAAQGGAATTTPNPSTNP